MADQWYFWHDSEILGPYTGKQLFDLATAGDIVPTDTVWKNGIEGGVPASRIQHLFKKVLAEVPVSELLAPAETPVTIVIETPAAAPAENTKPTEDKQPEPTAPKPPEPVNRWGDGSGSKPKSTARATAGKGAMIMGQDGTVVRFKMKCTTCGYEDTSFKTLPITRGTMRVVFYCQKCRKQKHCEINGHLS